MWRVCSGGRSDGNYFFLTAAADRKNDEQEERNTDAFAKKRSADEPLIDRLPECAEDLS